jgi:hypothetical protein
MDLIVGICLGMMFMAVWLEHMGQLVEVEDDDTDSGATSGS